MHDAILPILLTLLGALAVVARAVPAWGDRLTKAREDAAKAEVTRADAAKLEAEAEITGQHATLHALKSATARALAAEERAAKAESEARAADNRAHALAIENERLRRDIGTHRKDHER